MVEQVRSGVGLREVARHWRVSLWMVQRWVARARHQALEQVDWTDRSRAPHRRTRTSRAAEELVLAVRRELGERSALGEFGAPAIYRTLRERGVSPVPAVSTIGRILRRRGALDYRRRVRYPAPPIGWYLPEVASQRRELDCVDAVEERALGGGALVDILTCVSLHGGLPGAWPGPALTSKRTQEALEAHWRVVGLPGYVQFDNDPVFAGPHAHPWVLGRVIQLCLRLQVVPVFVPAREMGFQAAIEAFNGRWQAKVWHRFHHRSVSALCLRSDRYVRAYRHRLAPRLESAPPRRVFPRGWRFVMGGRPEGRLVYLRRTNEQGIVKVLGQPIPVQEGWAHRLVRCEVSLERGQVQIYALKRREPQQQPLLQTARGRWAFRCSPQ